MLPTSVFIPDVKPFSIQQATPQRPRVPHLPDDDCGDCFREAQATGGVMIQIRKREGALLACHPVGSPELALTHSPQPELLPRTVNHRPF